MNCIRPGVFRQPRFAIKELAIDDDGTGEIFLVIIAGDREHRLCGPVAAISSYRRFRRALANQNIAFFIEEFEADATAWHDYVADLILAFRLEQRAAADRAARYFRECREARGGAA